MTTLLRIFVAINVIVWTVLFGLLGYLLVQMGP